MATARRSTSVRVGILVFDGVKLLDVAGPAEAFAEANLLGASYELVLLSPDGNDVQSSVGMRVSVDAAATEAAGFHTVLVAGGDALPMRQVPARLVAAAGHLASNTQRMSSICTGAFILAAAGLLDGRRATTHWKHTKQLALRYPATQVEPDAIFVSDGGIHTSAGVTAGIDLALALIEDDHGPDLARAVARSLVVYMQRSGGQSQFSAPLQGEPPKSSPLRPVLDAVQADPAAEHSVPVLARNANLSVRHLTRLFREELQTTPSKYVELIRFDTAKALLDAATASQKRPNAPDSAIPKGYGGPSSRGSACRRRNTSSVSGRRRKTAERHRRHGRIRGNVVLCDGAGPPSRRTVWGSGTLPCRWTKETFMAEIIAGITVPDTELVGSATELVRDITNDLLFDHSRRVFLFGALQGRRLGLDVDHELLYVGALFHDLGLTDKYGTDKLRFEVDGANAAKSFLLDHGRSEADATKVWTAVALHTTPGVPEFMDPEIALVTAGVETDVLGIGYQDLDRTDIDAVTAAHPRPDFKRQILAAFTDGNKHRPETTFGNVNADVLEHFSPDFRRTDFVEIIQNSAWPE